MKRLIKSVLAAMAAISMLAVGCKGPDTPVVVSELTGITIKSAPAKTTYEVDAALDLAGLVITAAYSAGDPVDIEYSDETKEKIAASGFDSAKIGNPVVTVTYTEGEASKTATFKTSVIKTVPNEDGTTTVTKVNDDGATVATTTDANGDVVKTETTVEAEGIVTVTTENADGSSVVAVTDADGAKTTTSKDKDGNVTGIVEEKKDEAGNSVKVEIVYDAEGGRTETTTVTDTEGKEKSKTVDKYDKDGNKIIVNEDGTVTVVTLDSIAVDVTKATVTYEVGGTFSSTGIKVTATYSDKSTKDVTAQAKYTGYDMSKEGEQTVTVTVDKKTTTFKITVKAKAAEEEKPTPPAEEDGKTILKPGETYSSIKFDLTYGAKDSEWNNTNANSEYLYVDLTGITVAADDEFSISFEYSGISESATLITTASEVDAWSWFAGKSDVADGGKYSHTHIVTADGLAGKSGADLTDGNALFKIVLQNSDGDTWAGKNASVTITNLTVKYKSVSDMVVVERVVANSVSNYGTVAVRKANLESYISEADGDVKLILNCTATGAIDANDGIGQFSGKTSSYGNINNEESGHTLNFNSGSEAIASGDKFTVSVDAKALNELLVDPTDMFQIGIWKDFTIDSIVASYALSSSVFRKSLGAIGSYSTKVISKSELKEYKDAASGDVSLVLVCSVTEEIKEYEGMGKFEARKAEEGWPSVDGVEVSFGNSPAGGYKEGDKFELMFKGEDLLSAFDSAEDSNFFIAAIWKTYTIDEAIVSYKKK